jgi:hypothetical protein
LGTVDFADLFAASPHQIHTTHRNLAQANPLCFSAVAIGSRIQTGPDRVAVSQLMSRSLERGEAFIFSLRAAR